MMHGVSTQWLKSVVIGILKIQIFFKIIKISSRILNKVQRRVQSNAKN